MNTSNQETPARLTPYFKALTFERFTAARVAPRFRTESRRTPAVRRAGVAAATCGIYGLLLTLVLAMPTAAGYADAAAALIADNLPAARALLQQPSSARGAAAAKHKATATRRSRRANASAKQIGNRHAHSRRTRQVQVGQQTASLRTPITIRNVTGSIQTGITAPTDNPAAPTPPPDPVAQDVPTPVWRPFNDASPWNTPIPSAPALAPDSVALIDDLRSSSPYGEHLDINIANYSIPLFFASPTSPSVEVHCELGGWGFTGSGGYSATATFQIPADAAPDPEGDHHIVIVDPFRRTAWDMWNAQNLNGRWTCSLGAGIDLSGTGVRPYKPENPTWYTSHGARACGFPLLAGLIRTEEIDAGHINHALVIAYPHIRAGWYMAPASTAQARFRTAIKTRGIPCGGHIQLDPDLNLDAIGLTRAGRIVAEALQKYGAFVGDFSGAIDLYAENAQTAQAHWQGVLDTYEFRDKLDMSALRVLAYGTLTDDGNGD